MKQQVTLNDITIRTELREGDIGYLTYLHGNIYKQEYDYGIPFELIVASGLDEFYRQYNPANNRVWICEHENKIIGSILLLNRGTAAQLRFFFILPAYRGIGLGKKLMNLYMDFFNQCNYTSSYLWTTSELVVAAQLYKKYEFVPAEEKPSLAFGKAVIEQLYILNRH